MPWIWNPRISRPYLENGYTMKETGAVLGLHYTTISVIIRQAEQRTLQSKTCPPCPSQPNLVTRRNTGPRSATQWKRCIRMGSSWS